MKTMKNFARGGKRKDINDMYFRSTWEANYARYLLCLVASGKIKSWRYEKKVFVFDKITTGCTRYKPDFEIIHLDDSVEYIEIKGWMDAKSKTKLTRMKKYYPDVKVTLIDGPEYEKIRKVYGSKLQNWE